MAPGVAAKSFGLKPIDIYFYGQRGATADDYVIDAPADLDYGVLEI